MDHVDLDDAIVVSIRRNSDSIIVELKRFGKKITVSATGVDREDAECYVGDRVRGPHPDPALPVKEVEMAEMAPGVLELSGGRHPELNWYLWRIVASNIEIEMD